MSERQQKWLYLIPFALVLCALLPFLNKAYTIDDTLFLLQAQQAIKDPLHPTAFDVVWDKNVWMRCSAIMPSGPVMAFLLIPAILLDGAEWIAHAVQLAVLCLGLVGCLRLARTLGFSRAEASFAVTMIAVSPCVLGMASTAMPDVPSMAFGAFGLDFFLRWHRDRRADYFLGAVLFLAASALSRPHAGAVLGVAFLAAAAYDPGAPLFKRLRWRWPEIVPLLIVAILVVSYGFLFKDPAGAGGTLASSTKSLSGWTQPERHFVSFLAHWAFTTPVMLLLVVAVPSRIDWRLVTFSILPLATLIVGIQYEEQAWVAIPTAVALAGLVFLLRKNPGLLTSHYLALASALLLPLPLVIYVHLPAKYLLTSIPAGAMLVTAHWRAVSNRSHVRRAVAILCLGIYFSLGTLVIRGDEAFAQLGRRAAAELIAPLVKQGHRVWFAGHWGFQWYAMRAGGQPLTLDAGPAPRDYVVGGSWQYDGGPVAEKFPNKVLIDRLHDTVFWGHVMKADLGAGFYSNWWGLLPWAYGRRPVEEFTRWQFLYGASDP